MRASCGWMKAGEDPICGACCGPHETRGCDPKGEVTKLCTNCKENYCVWESKCAFPATVAMRRRCNEWEPRGLPYMYNGNDTLRTRTHGGQRGRRKKEVWQQQKAEKTKKEMVEQAKKKAEAEAKKQEQAATDSEQKKEEKAKRKKEEKAVKE